MSTSTSDPSKQQPEESLALTVVQKHPKDLLLIVFIHGFKGTESTFETFPLRLQHILTESMNDVPVECVVFPAYETKGDLNAAVVRFADWLTTLTVQKEVANGGGAGRVKIVLCGHSMGGLLAADSLLEFINTRPDKSAPLWPRIIACIAFDTPYLGLHPFVFKNSATKAVEYASAARTVVSDAYSLFRGSESSAATTPTRALPQITAAASESASTSTWAKWAPAAFAVGGAVIAGAAAGAAYMRRDDVTSGYSWASDHMKYVGNLWDEKAMRERVENLLAAHTDHGIVFKIFYVTLPASPPAHSNTRTFVVLPPRSSPVFRHYHPAPNCVAADEVQAHMGMFKPGSNDGYYQLGLGTAQIIREAVMRSRTEVCIDHSDGAGS
ncbi:hypothetical protein PAXINDRAFT_7558 [Paxillus involutus ATCC 200175]|nr:hypothetical protein PAXINDRAFT_7558 [Paxillus involutus ATCC 200175]